MNRHESLIKRTGKPHWYPVRIQEPAGSYSVMRCVHDRPHKVTRGEIRAIIAMELAWGWFAPEGKAK